MTHDRLRHGICILLILLFVSSFLPAYASSDGYPYIDQIITLRPDSGQNTTWQNPSDAYTSEADIKSATYTITEVRRDAVTTEEVSGLIRDLGSNDAAVRQAAIDRLVKIGLPAVDALLAALNSNSNTQVSLGVVETLGRLDYSQATDTVRKSVADGLLNAALNFYNTDISFNACKALAKIGDTFAVEALLKALECQQMNGSMAYIRGTAAAFLGEVDYSKLPDALKTRVIDALSSMVSNDKNWFARLNAVYALYKIDDPRTIVPLIKALGDSDWQVQARACDGLVYKGGDQVVAALLHAMSNTNADVRANAAYVLSQMDYSNISETLKAAAVDILKDNLQDTNATVRAIAAEALAKIGDRSAVNALIDALGDANVDVRCSAAYALGKIGDPEAVNALIAALRDSEPIVRSIAAASLGKIGDPRAFDALWNAYSSEKNPVALRGILAGIAGIARNNPDLKATVAQGLNLDGIRLDIWNRFGVLVMNNGGGNFSDAQLTEISRVLDSLPADFLQRVFVITSESVSDNDTLGLTWSYTNTVGINLKNDWNDTMKNFASVLLHEIGHQIHFAMPDAQAQNFFRLNYDSGGLQDFARRYGLTGGLYEDFATMFEAYTADSAAIMARANAQAANGQTILLDKVRAMAALFAHTGADGQQYTYIFSTNANGQITRTEVQLGSNGLPVLP